MKLNVIKATLLVAFLVFTTWLTVIGLNTNTARIDFKALEKSRTEAMNKQSESSFESMLKNIGNTTRLIKPDILTSTDTARLSLAIRLLDSNKQYAYAGVLSEKLARLQTSSYRYFMASKYFLTETYSHQNPQNELMYIKRARMNLEKSLEISPSNNDAKVDLAICIYNINKMQGTDNQMELMKPTLLLLEVERADSSHIDAVYYLASLSREIGKYEKAVARFKKLVSLQPQNQQFYLELSKTYEIMGNQTEAKEWADKARNLK